MDQNGGSDRLGAVAEYFAAITRSEVSSVKHRSEGYLIVESGLTVVTKQQGKSLFNTGFYRQNRLHLYPEEATCLAHRGVLDIRLASTEVSSAPGSAYLSLRDLNDRLNVHVPRECREVYCFLKDRKFIPRRVQRSGTSTHRPVLSTATNVSIAYAVHAPGKKSDPPLFNAVVFRMSDPLPPLDALLQLTQTRQDCELLTANTSSSCDHGGSPSPIPIKLFACDGEGGVIALEMLMPQLPSLPDLS
ncbi:hypothetical protein DYB32_000782 [Aphanomyces invadans]|uniref:tRNA-splicing endonuclease subunit Sen54 N-terminal domain-containing protein n=1 Tax=Aphanomyces invadans TaxID=157072 RepID=A0A3R6ZWP3_9STRA|nr:hypothetical protein DYB32_000782 [Aphanomyces invadans]